MQIVVESIDTMGMGPGPRIDNKSGFQIFKYVLRITCIAVHPDDHDVKCMLVLVDFAGQKYTIVQMEEIHDQFYGNFT